ncbi:lipopolysaccharide biosynthesis protein [Brevundimonas sp. VNH65]|uniref:lipopolysaccharide biosynthesis protein n=1 Tax=Brevundimonas sp. VNH65 TaxID=3400917 RepID=UPI003C0B0B0C
MSTGTSARTRIREGAASLIGAANSLQVRKLVGGAALSGGLKLIGMGLGFLFYLAVAAVTGPEAYGVFAAGFSLATIAGFAATLGQHTAVLRFWPAIDQIHGPGVASHAIVRSFRLTLAGSIAVAVALFIVGIVQRRVAGGGPAEEFYLVVGVLGAAFALSEFAVAAARARGALWWALAPRDIGWRVLVIAVCGGVALLPATADRHVAISGPVALLIAAVTLLLVTAPQLAIVLKGAAADVRQHFLPLEEKRAMIRATPGLWGGAIAEPIGNQAATLIVGLALGPVAAGAFFAASRLSQLLAIPLVGITMVSAPMMARAWRGNAVNELRGIFWGTAAAATLGTAVGVIGMAFVGRTALAMFDPHYASAFLVLLILSASQLVNAAAGSVKTLYQMTGHDRRFLAIETLWALAGIGMVWWGGVNHGLVGAALGFLAQRFARNLHALLGLPTLLRYGRAES